MKLKFKVKTLDGIPEELHGLYVQLDDGTYMLSVDGVVEKSKLDEFRTNNIDLLKKLDQFKDVDPEKLKEMVETQRKLDEKKLIDAGDIEGLVAKRVTALKQEYDAANSELTSKLDLSMRQLETLLIDNKVRDHASAVGVAPSAIQDVLLRAKSVFKVEDGQPVAIDHEGNKIYSKDGVSPVSVKEWVTDLKTTAPHLFMQSQGSGSGTTTGPRSTANMSAVEKIAAGLKAGSSNYV